MFLTEEEDFNDFGISTPRLAFMRKVAIVESSILGTDSMLPFQTIMFYLTCLRK